MDFQKRAMVSFDTDFKSGFTEEETLWAKDIKRFQIFWAPVQPLTAECKHRGTFVHEGTCLFIPAMGTNPALLL